MILCFPVQEENGLTSMVFNHFGSAPHFVLYDTEAKTVTPLINQDLNHVHGQCSPIKALDGNIVDAVIVGGIGRGAINKLNSMGIRVYKSQGGSIEGNVASFEKQELVEMKPEDACGGHAGGGTCAH